VDPVAVDPPNQALQFAHEAATVGEVDQRIQVRKLVKLLHALLKARYLASKRANLLDQPLTIPDVDDVA